MRGRWVTSLKAQACKLNCGCAQPCVCVPCHCITQGAPLHHWRHEFLVWASMRGQLLQRTVHGMT